MGDKRFKYMENSDSIFDSGSGLRYRTGCSLSNLLNHLAKKADRATPIENGKNRYGLDVGYFRNAINRELNRPLSGYKPDELARVLARLSRTADPSVMHEPEFKEVQSNEKSRR